MSRDVGDAAEDPSLHLRVIPPKKAKKGLPPSRATRVAPHTHRHPQTVLGWVHAYNEHGPEALVYRRTGGRPPFARGSQRPWRRASAPPAARLPRPR